MARDARLLYVGAMRAALFLALPLALAACGQRFSPDSYATRAVQQVNRVEQGVIIGRRDVAVQLDGSTGAAAGGAAGGVIGAQTPGGNMAGAIGAVGGALIGGLFGTAAERVVGDTTAHEYVVRKTNGDLISVTQRDERPLEVGLRVLVIAGAQARIISDYTLPGEPPPTSLPADAGQRPAEPAPPPPVPVPVRDPPPTYPTPSPIL